MGFRNKAANTLGCSLLLAHSREAQWGYLKWQLAATADYTSSPRWIIIKEKKKIYVFQSGELHVKANFKPAKHTKPLSRKPAEEQYCE